MTGGRSRGLGRKKEECLKAMAPRKGRQEQYGNESISALKGAERVRKRPGVIFGSNALEGCEHAVFEILSNAIGRGPGGPRESDCRHPV